MNGAITIPLNIDDSAIRDELANLRLQAAAMVATQATIVASLAALASGLAEVKAGGDQTRHAVEQLGLSVVSAHDATQQQLTQIEAELAVLRDLVPEHHPTFVLTLSVRNKETHG